MTETCLRCNDPLSEFELAEQEGLCVGCLEENKMLDPIDRGMAFKWRGQWRGDPAQRPRMNGGEP